MITLKQAAIVFEKWETEYRASPEEFLTSEEVSQLGVSEVSAQRAEYFIQLLKDTE